MTYLRNIAFYLAFYGGSVIFVLSAFAMLPVSDRAMRAICDAWSAWHHWCCRNLLGIAIVETGTRPEGAALYAVKHEAFFEAIGIPATFDNPAGFAKEELFAIPGWGKAARAYGAIPVRRDAGAKGLREMLRDVQPYIVSGRPIVIFPEGTRVPHGERPPLQAGFAALYKLLGLPVVPVAVDSGPLYHRPWKRRGTITMHFGEPIPPGLPRKDVEAKVHAAINCLNASRGVERIPPEQV